MSTPLKFETPEQLLMLLRETNFIANYSDINSVGDEIPSEVFGSIKIVASTIDNECEYDGYSTIDAYRIWHFIDYDVYVKFVGEYSSYAGFDISDLEIVRPVEKTIIVYE